MYIKIKFCLRFFDQSAHIVFLISSNTDRMDHRSPKKLGTQLEYFRHNFSIGTRKNILETNTIFGICNQT